MKGLEPLSKARGAMAQLHGHLGKLLTTKIDAVTTSDLNSGKDQAKHRRKDLAQRALRLYDELEALIKDIDKRIAVTKQMLSAVDPSRTFPGR